MDKEHYFYQIHLNMKVNGFMEEKKEKVQSLYLMEASSDVLGKMAISLALVFSLSLQKVIWLTLTTRCVRFCCSFQFLFLIRNFAGNLLSIVMVVHFVSKKNQATTNRTNALQSVNTLWCLTSLVVGTEGVAWKIPTSH